MVYNYVFTEKAAEDLDATLKYISEDLSNPSAAKNFFEKLFNLIEKIREYPQAGMVVDNEYLSDATIRKMLLDNYVIYYKEDAVAEQIAIVRIVYGKRNLAEIMKTI